jgi:tetratricopeptide (TPR) repeat protein
LMSLFSMIRSAIKGEPGPTSRPAVVTAPEEEAQRSPAQIHFDIALTYHKAGELDEAIARYRQAIAHDDQFGLAYYNLGLAYLAKERSPLAASAFRAALKARGDMAVQVEASRRLRELSQAEEAPDAEPAARGSPLEPGSKVEGSAGGAAPLDPAIARRLWLRLSLGAALAIVLGGAAWLFVAVVMLGALG